MFLSRRWHWISSWQNSSYLDSVISQNSKVKLSPVPCQFKKKISTGIEYSVGKIHRYLDSVIGQTAVFSSKKNCMHLYDRKKWEQNHIKIRFYCFELINIKKLFRLYRIFVYDDYIFLTKVRLF